MSYPTFPTAQEVDIFLILEGTFPFARGGVSSWVYDLIRFFPNYRFGAIFLGTREEDYPKMHYTLPKNLVHLEAHFIFSENTVIAKHKPAKRIAHSTMESLEHMHDHFRGCLHNPSQDIPELFNLIAKRDEVNQTFFLRGKQSWEFLISRYYNYFSDQSFFDFFWGIRNLHYPIWKILNIINTVPKFKLLHSASTGYAGFLGALLQNKFQKPYIITEHGIYTKERWIELMRNYFFNYVVKAGNHIHEERGLIMTVMNFFTILAKISYGASSANISLIEEYRQRQIKDGAPPETTKIIPYGIDFNTFKFLGKKKPNQDHPIIGFIGRVVPIKDVKSFIKTCALILQKMPHAEAWIVGSDEEDPGYAETCRELVETLGIQDKVLFKGVQNVMDVYSTVDVIILCSISEGSPFVILESFAVGVPIVTTDVGGCRELIEGKNEEDRALGNAGRLVQIADPDGLADATIELLTQETAWISAQEVGLKRVKKYYSIEQFIVNYSLIYEEALSNGGNRV